MQEDLQLVAAARAIFDACYPTDDWSPFTFEEARRYGTVHYRQAVEAAQRVRGELGAPAKPFGSFCGITVV
jgi:hypothetical protein